MSLPTAFLRLVTAAIPALGVAWLVDLPHHVGFAVIEAEYILVIAGLSVAAGFLLKPYRGEEPGWLECTLALVALAAWFWGAWNYSDWLLSIASRPPEKWLPGAIGVVLMTEAMRRNCGLAISLVVVGLILYGLFGSALPGAFEALYQSPQKLVVYLYTDSNAVPGLVLGVGATIVLAFVLMGRAMELSGASRTFTDTAMGLMGHRRGGPAKVAVVASSVFGTVNGTTVGNIMGTGVITIPLMKRTGFPPHYAAAIEAVASNGGQLAPPVMGTTAFLIANFLEVSYVTVMLAAILPAVIYYLVVFGQVDRVAQVYNIAGLPRSELPSTRRTLARGWSFVLPIAVLLYLLVYLGYNPGKSALYAAILMLILGLVLRRFGITFRFLLDLFSGAGSNLTPLLLVCGGAGVIIGVLNSTGLGQSLADALRHIGESAGILPMLGVTAFIAIILGMGMPTAAVYLVLSVVLAPAIVDMGIEPMAAHLFIFYFGLLSMLTPPVAIASFVAAGLAGSDMWRTGLTGLKLAFSAYLLPFLFVFNPALIMQGTILEILLAGSTAILSGIILAVAMEPVGVRGMTRAATQAFYLAAALVVGSSTLWLGPSSLWVLVAAAAGLALILLPAMNKTQSTREKQVQP